MSPGTRDHDPLVIEEFNGLWDRGDPESCPLDHFTQADNVDFIYSGFETRDPIDKYQAEANSLDKVQRIYDYVMQTGQSLLVLKEGGKIYHLVGTSTLYGPILTIAAMQDFGFVAFNGIAYITPFKTYLDTNGRNYQLGIENEFLYVYKGDGNAARKAGGVSPSNSSKLPFLAYPSATDGVVDLGTHVLAVAFDHGILGTEVFPVVLMINSKQIQLINIPIGPGGTTSRTIAMTKVIDPYNADQTLNTYYEALTIGDNTTTTATINLADTDLTVVYVPGATAAPAPAALLVANTNTDGFCDFGFHLIGVVYETDTGFITAPGPEFFGGQTYIDTTKEISISNIPISPDSFVTKRHLVSTKWIPEYNGDQKGYQFFYIPNGTIDDNVTTTKTVSYYDSDLIDDASHLIDNFTEIPSCVNLCLYHSRLVLVGEFGTVETRADLPAHQVDNRSLARISAVGEPEAISKVDGLIVVPLDGNALTNCQEYQDILYLFKNSRTYGYSDNDDVPSSWKEKVIDQSIGTSVHGIATVLDTGGVNVDYLLVANWSGFMLFNGVYSRPELSWKIEDIWLNMDRNNFQYIQIVTDSLSKFVWMTLPPPNQEKLLYADYKNGLDAQKIRWARWIFDTKMSTLALIDTTKLILGSSADV